MNSRRISLRKIAELCDLPGPEDGVDPRRIARRASRKKKKAIQKDRQLCSEADVALRLALSDMGDEDAGALEIVRVEPAPDASHLRVLVTHRNAGPDLDPGQLTTLLDRIEARLRTSVAAAIHRKRAPSLSFVLVPTPGPDGQGTDREEAHHDR